MIMDRREALKRTALLMGTALSSSAVAGVLAGCEAETTTGAEEAWTPAFLSDQQAAWVDNISEHILPRTATPGARDAGVMPFIDRMLSEYYTEEEANLFAAGLDKLVSTSRIMHGIPYLDCSTEQQHDIIAAAAREAMGMLQRPMTAAPLAAPPFFLMMKELTLLGFFTSEAGATEVLAYDPVPGGYTGCAPLAELGGKVWII